MDKYMIIDKTSGERTGSENLGAAEVIAGDWAVEAAIEGYEELVPEVGIYKLVSIAEVKTERHVKHIKVK